MNTEQLFEQIGELEDELLLQSETPPQSKHFPWKRKFSRWICLAACAAAVAAIIAYSSSAGGNSFLPQEQADSNNFEAKKVQPPEDETIGSSESLLDQDGQIFCEKGIGIQETIPVGAYQAVYEEIKTADQAALEQSLGTEVADLQSWHHMLGHSDMQYLISSENGTCTLWKFCYFKEENYPYSDVLKLVYNIHSADGIRSLVSRPAVLDNIGEGKRLQDEIGELQITDRKEIENIYQILTSMTCLGGENWGDVDLETDLVDNQADTVRRGCDLSIIAADGNVIDALRYTTFSNRFYEYSGVAYRSLSPQQADEIKRILQIEN
ncbi:MAG: hypothetical protein HFI75_03745 [Lachnospiraceae bacterium]|nr:hypothetical protein [Lachnospiraceae bacterium]